MPTASAMVSCCGNRIGSHSPHWQWYSCAVFATTMTIPWNEDSATGLLQHYGVPTPFIDFTMNLRHAVAFAASGGGSKRVGRICVFDLDPAKVPSSVSIVDLANHRWCERPRRQDAYAVNLNLPIEWYLRGHGGLKANDVREALALRWYQFRVTDDDSALLAAQMTELLRLDNDPSAGFIRHHITDYVEECGKFSPELADWLLERIPIMPRCYEVISFEDDQVHMRHLPPSKVGVTDSALERDRSRRYWSTTFQDSSRDRTKDWPPPIGAIYVDPRTFHGDSCLCH